jgi:hypothetical protein
MLNARIANEDPEKQATESVFVRAPLSPCPGLIGQTWPSSRSMESTDSQWLPLLLLRRRPLDKDSLNLGQELRHILG